MEDILNYFEGVTDPRSNRNQKHPLKTLIGTTLLASLCGIDSLSGFSDFTECHYEKLQEHFNFPYGVPSHETYQRFWDAVNPVEFYKSFEEFTETIATITGEYIHIDGKTIRNSGNDKALHIVNAWCHGN